jgi:hypothetical protein
MNSDRFDPVPHGLSLGGSVDRPPIHDRSYRRFFMSGTPSVKILCPGVTPPGITFFFMFEEADKKKKKFFSFRCHKLKSKAFM